MIKILLIFLLLVGCGSLPDEGTLKRKTASVRISYTGFEFKDLDLRHNRSTPRSASSQNLFPVYHYISVEPEVEEVWLDSSMSAEVLVPVDTPLWVEYMNWTEDQPDIYYQYGVSDKFVVTHESPEKVTINISVDINPEYPEEQEEEEEEETECTVNCTVDNETEEETETEEEEIDTTLLAHYKFEGDLTDSSSYGRDLELCTGSTAFSYSIANFQGWEGPSGQAAWFYGGQCAENEFRGTTGASPLGMSDDFTISFWINPTLSNQNFDEWHSVMSTGDSTSGYRFQIDHSGNEELRFAGALKVDIEADWIFFTYTKSTGTILSNDNKKVRVYKNGELKSYMYPITTLWDKLKIGMNRNGGGGWYGFIDDIRIYDRAFTEDEIEELYESYE